MTLVGMLVIRVSPQLTAEVTRPTSAAPMGRRMPVSQRSARTIAASDNLRFHKTGITLWQLGLFHIH